MCDYSLIHYFVTASSPAVPDPRRDRARTQPGNAALATVTVKVSAELESNDPNTEATAAMAAIVPPATQGIESYL